ncbi:hypothetical protein [Flexithrix dorotheae]|uniref:hypothetical protein n=1 Tax=Flexithrix dorotheae TaxID=70993 RepID=UPI000364922B|nr:hypothetical protein [Flexithrix dorotheae]
MKTITFPLLNILIIPGFISLCLMILVDFLLGPEAEFLNAWLILNRLLGFNTNLPESLILKQFGLGIATAIMILSNLLIGQVLRGLFFLFLKF